MSLQFDPEELNPTEQYKLLSGTIIPRPIALPSICMVALRPHQRSSRNHTGT
jgi:hypothetical protein